MYHSTHNIYLVQELCKNGDLRSILRKSNGVLSELQAIKFLRDIVAGMQALHKENVVHRDLKPENILQGELGQMKIGDFGFAR